MKAQTLALLLLAACHSSKPAAPVEPPPTPSPAVSATPAPASTKTPPAAADTPATTAAGNGFIVPAGWTVEVRGPATILAPPEPGSYIALVDLQAADGKAALAAAWAAYKPDMTWKVIADNAAPDKDGWTQLHSYQYETSPSEHRAVAATTLKSDAGWTVILVDAREDVLEKRGSQLGVALGYFLPKGHARESFAGKTAAKLDDAHLAAIAKFVEDGRVALGVPGVAVGIVQDGKVVFAKGFGTRELGGKVAVDQDTLFMIASNTKALTTLMLAKLVDEKALTWETPVTQLMPTFKLGNADTTQRVLVKHLICACTGLPREDLQWLLEYGKLTPESAMTMLGGMQPTSAFGELFQYSNPLAAGAGFVGGHVAFGKLELGAAYDQAMQTRVFGPLKMTSTTFDMKRALKANHAGAYSFDIDSKPAPALMAINESIGALRPAGGAWSNVRDMLKYVQMELDRGALPGGKRFISEEALLARRAPQVAIGKDATYGMGLMVDRKWGVEVVHHGGDLVGYHSDMMWLPDSKVGAVILTNGDAGSTLRSIFQRKLLEVLFDGHPEADAQVASAAKNLFADMAVERKLITVPAAAADAGALAPHYTQAQLGDITVARAGGKTTFDFGEWKSEVASKHNPDGSVSFLTIEPGVGGIELAVGPGPAKTLVLRDGQHEYVFEAK